MLDLFGREYVIDHCISALNSWHEEELFRIYVTETLRSISKGVGYEFTKSFTDFVEMSRPKAKEEERSSEDIISNIRKKAEAIA